MARVRLNTTKYEIIQVASEFFLEKGYSVTSPKMVAEELGLSTGNITYYFPTKEHLLAVIVEMLCEFQWKLLELEAEKNIDSIGSMCIEMMTVAAACQESPLARDFFTAVYQSNMCRDYLRNNHAERSKRIFAEQCSGWTEEDFIQAELLIIGIQYSTITATDEVLPLKKRIAGAINQILTIYNVDEATRKAEIEKVIDMDCRDIGKKVLSEFVKYVEQKSEEALGEILRSRRKSKK